ncbi:MAG: Kazal-type serine protease inhibitor family protein [Gammaproteobacteria bacterium]
MPTTTGCKPVSIQTGSEPSIPCFICTPHRRDLQIKPLQYIQVRENRPAVTIVNYYNCPSVYEPVCGHDSVCFSEPQNCPSVYEPVCGHDGFTYSNSCEANNAGTTVAYEGSCLAL